MKCLNYKLIYYLMALRHIVTAQITAVKHKPNTPKSPANQPSLSGPHYAPLAIAPGGSGAGNITGKATRVTKIVILRTPVACRDLAKCKGSFCAPKLERVEEVVARGPGAGNEKFKFFPENSEVTSLSLEEQKEQGNIFFHWD